MKAKANPLTKEMQHNLKAIDAASRDSRQAKAVKELSSWVTAPLLLRGLIERNKAGTWCLTAKGHTEVIRLDDADDKRCPHGMFFTGAGACPECSS